MCRCKLENDLACAEIAPNRVQRPLENMEDSNGGGQVIDAVHAVHELADVRMILNSRLDDRKAAVRITSKVCTTSGGKVIHDDHIVTAIEMAINEMRSDEPGATCDKNAHPHPALGTCRPYTVSSVNISATSRHEVCGKHPVPHVLHGQQLRGHD